MINGINEDFYGFFLYININEKYAVMKSDLVRRWLFSTGVQEMKRGARIIVINKIKKILVLGSWLCISLFYSCFSFHDFSLLVFSSFFFKFFLFVLLCDSLLSSFIPLEACFSSPQSHFRCVSCSDRVTDVDALWS